MKTYCCCLYRRLLLLAVFSCILQFTYSQPPTPKFQGFKGITSTSSPSPQPVNPVQSTPFTSHDPDWEINQRITQQSRVMTMPGQGATQKQTTEEVKREIRNIQFELERSKNANFTEAYSKSFGQFLQLNPDSFSITKAIYLSETPWYGASGKSYKQFKEGIRQWGEVAKQILKREKLKETNSLSVNYAIQKLYSQSNNFYDSLNKRTYTIEKLKYDFDDFWGDKEWSKMFVTKLLEKGSGQCTSLPEFYLCLAEELNAKAYLSLSPNHSFIQFFDEQGHRYNFETTNGNLVTQNFHMQCGYISATALKNGMYLDTLSSRKLYAQILGNMLLGYSTRVPRFDMMANKMTQRILSVDSNNIIGLSTLANIHRYNVIQLSKAADYPPEKEFPNHPKLNAEYQLYKAYEHRLEELGYQDIPAQAYELWLRSVEREKQNEQIRQEQKRIDKQIKQFKKQQHSFINKPKQ